MTNEELDRRVTVLRSIQAHSLRYPEPHNQVVRDIAERFQITTSEVMRQMRENQEERSMVRPG